VFKKYGTHFITAFPVLKNKMGHLKIKNYESERVETFKYLGVILSEINSNQMDLQERIENVNKIFFWFKKCLNIKTYQRN